MPLLCGGRAPAQGTAAARVAPLECPGIGAPGDLGFRTGPFDQDVACAALPGAKEGEGPFDGRRDEKSRAEGEAVFGGGKERLPPSRAIDVDQLLPSELRGAVFDRAAAVGREIGA